MADTSDYRVQKEALSQLETFKTEANTANQEQQEKFVEWFALYSLKDQRRNIEPWLSNLQITGAFEFVERPFAIMAANTPSFELESNDPATPKIELEPEILDDDGITVIKPALRIDFKEVYESDLSAMFSVRRMKQKTRELVKGILIYGTYHAEVIQEIVERDEFMGIIEDETEGEDQGEKEEFMYAKIIDQITPDVELVEPFNVLVSPYARDPEDAIERFGGFGVVRNNVSLRELDEDVYMNLEELKRSLTSSGDGEDYTNSQKEQKDQIVSPVGEEYFQNQSFNLTEVWCYFKDSTEDSGKEEKYIIGEANGVLVRFEKVDDMEECPFVVAKNQEVPGQYWGVGEVEPIMSDLIEENTIRNQRIDYNNRLLNEEWMLRTDAGIDPRNLVSKPHNIIVGDDIGDSAIRQVQRTTAPLAASGQDIDRIRRNMASTTGSIDTIATGGVGNVTNTATGERIREQNAIARYAAKMENIEFAIAEIARKMLTLKARNLDESEEIPVFVRGKWRLVSAKLYKKYIDKYIIRVRGGSMNVRNSITERNDRIAMINVALQAAQVLGPDAIDFEALYRDLFGTFPNADVDKIIPNKPPALPETQGQAGPATGQVPSGLPNSINELGMGEEVGLQQPELNQPQL